MSYKNDEELLDLADLHLKNKNYELSELYYLIISEKGKSNDNDNIDYGYVFECLGFINFMFEKYNESEKYYLQSIQNKHHYSYYNLGIIYNKINNFTKAKKMFKKAVEYNSDALIKLGDIYIKQNKYNKSEKYYIKAIKKDNKQGIDKLENLSKKRVYNVLSNIKNKNKQIENKLKKIKQKESLENKIFTWINLNP